MKVMRFSVILSLIRRNIYKRMHPNAVVAVKVGDKVISADVASNIVVFFALYILVFFIGCILLSFDGQSFETTISASIAALSNTGLGFGNVGFGYSFNSFSGFGRIVLTFMMLIGRLELFTIIMLFAPEFWRGVGKNR